MNAMRPDQISEAIDKQRRKDVRDCIVTIIFLVVLLVIIVAGLIASVLG